MPLTENDLSSVYTGDVLSASGEKIGSVGQIYLDDQSGEPTFVTANTGLFGMSQSFVPLRGARVDGGNVVVDFDKTTVKDAPRIDDDGSLSPAEEDQLYAYYGMSTSNVDTADYGTADQTPEPGYARAGDDQRPDLVPGDSGLGDRTDDVRTDDVRGDDVRGDRPDLVPGDSGLGDRTDDDRSAVVGRDDRADEANAGIDPRRGTDFGGPTADNQTMPVAPPADQDRDRTVGDQDRVDQDRLDQDRGDQDRLDQDHLDQDRGDQDRGDRDGDGEAAVPPAAEPASGGGRLRKWVMTEYEPVKSEEVYVQGQGQPGEPSTR